MLGNIDEAVKFITKKVLTPVLYMLRYDDRINFICFCDKNLDFSELYNISEKITDMLQTPAEVVDIREFCEFDRLEILKTAELVHSEDPFIEQLFVASMTEDFKNIIREKTMLLERNKETGTCFIQ